jgi:hypothetical protein
MSAQRAPQSKPASQRDDVEGDGGLLCVAFGPIGEKARRPEAPQIGDNHPMSRLRQQGRDLHEAMNVVGPAVQQEHGGAFRRADFCVAHAERACVYLLDRRERNALFWLG